MKIIYFKSGGYVKILSNGNKVSYSGNEIWSPNSILIKEKQKFNRFIKLYEHSTNFRLEVYKNSKLFKVHIKFKQSWKDELEKLCNN